MRLVRCPACQTVFRLRPEQLRAHGGMVRCGHCFTLFDARDHFVDSVPPRHSEPTPPKPVAPVSPPPQTRRPDPPVIPNRETLFVLEEPTPPQVDDSTRQDQPVGTTEAGLSMAFDALDFSLPADFRSSTAPAPKPVTPELTSAAPPPAVNALRRRQRGNPPQAPVTTPAVEPVAVPTTDPTTDQAVPERLQRPSEPSRDPMAQDPVDDNGRVEPRFNPDVRTTAERIARPAPARTADRDERPPLQETTHIPEPTPDHHEPDDDAVSRYAPIEVPPTSAGTRWLQGLTMGALLGLLGAQSAYVLREDITRQWPELRPVYLTACARLGCELPLPREASLIDIETSDLEIEPSNPSQYTLNTVVRNRAHFPQQHPYLELTLTDSRDRPVVRRVLAPPEWVSDPQTLASGLPPASPQTVRLSFQTNGVANAVGYRIYAFFP